MSRATCCNSLADNDVDICTLSVAMSGLMGHAYLMSPTDDRRELAGERVKELQARRSELAAGKEITNKDVLRARQNAEKALRRSANAHDAAARQHSDAALAHTVAATYHEEAMDQRIGDADEHLAAAQRHRDAADDDEREAQQDRNAAQDDR